MSEPSTQSEEFADLIAEARGELARVRFGARQSGRVALASHLDLLHRVTTALESVTRDRVVTTVEELDSLPVGSVVLDYEQEAWQKVGIGFWVSTSGGSGRLDWSEEPEENQRFRVLFIPGGRIGRG